MPNRATDYRRDAMQDRHKDPTWVEADYSPPVERWQTCAFCNVCV